MIRDYFFFNFILRRIIIIEIFYEKIYSLDKKFLNKLKF